MPKERRTNRALSPAPTERLITPAEKARQLGVTTDTLRRWENEGRMVSTRTAGGQRRYRESDQPAALDVTHQDPELPDDESRSEDQTETDDESSSAPPSRPTPRWQQRVEEKKADVEIARLDREHRAVLRAEAAESAERIRRREREDREAQERRSRELRDLEESRRLEGLIRQGMTLAAVAPMEFQAAAKRDLISFVTNERFPAELTRDEAAALLRRRLERILKPWRDDQHIDGLMRDARAYATLSTIGADWDFEPGQQARREVERTLSREVRADWTTEDMRARVDEILGEWE